MGSSTNYPRLLAVMLGRLRMGIDECIRAYLEFFEHVFAKPRSLFHLYSPLKIHAQYDQRKLQEAAREIVVMSGLPEEALLKDPEADCRV